MQPITIPVITSGRAVCSDVNEHIPTCERWSAAYPDLQTASVAGGFKDRFEAK